MEITKEEILRLITELRNNDESPCIEAKENELEVEKFGKTISAISNKRIWIYYFWNKRQNLGNIRNK